MFIIYLNLVSVLCFVTFSYFIMLGGYFGYSGNTNTGLSIFEYGSSEYVNAYV